MSVTVYFANVSKRRNSTLQGTFTVSYDCTLKAPTSLDRPTFLVSAATMDYNAAKFENRYYFIDDVVSVRNGQWEVSCVLDVLATYKADILASTQYVIYSSYNSSIWLPDTRIPVLKSVHYDGSSWLPSPMAVQYGDGFYVLTVNGKSGCDAYAVTKAQIADLIENINNWAIDDYDKILDGTFDPDHPVTYQWGTTEEAVQSLSIILTQSGAIGNAYQNAPQMIRSCIWLPFDSSYFTSGVSERIYLGDYDTEIDAPKVKVKPYTAESSLQIKWRHSDWRRSICETVYVNLPYAGVVQLPSDSLTHLSSLDIRISISPIDGNIAYSVSTGSDMLGYYAGNCAANYAIGINQKTGLADIIQTLIAGVENTVAVAVDSSISPMSALGAAAGIALEGVNTAYQTANAAMSTHPSCIGSMGGAAASQLQQYIGVYTVSHDTVIAPADMAATMGRPTMAPMSLSSLTGFCQCANAHVAVAAQAREIDAIDYYLNSGFFIE